MSQPGSDGEAKADGEWCEVWNNSNKSEKSGDGDRGDEARAQWPTLIADAVTPGMEPWRARQTPYPKLASGGRAWSDYGGGRDWRGASDWRGSNKIPSGVYSGGNTLWNAPWKHTSFVNRYWRNYGETAMSHRGTNARVAYSSGVRDDWGTQTRWTQQDKRRVATAEVAERSGDRSEEKAIKWIVSTRASDEPYYPYPVTWEIGEPIPEDPEVKPGSEGAPVSIVAESDMVEFVCRADKYPIEQVFRSVRFAGAMARLEHRLMAGEIVLTKGMWLCGRHHVNVMHAKECARCYDAQATQWVHYRETTEYSERAATRVLVIQTPEDSEAAKKMVRVRGLRLCGARFVDSENQRSEKPEIWANDWAGKVEGEHVGYYSPYPGGVWWYERGDESETSSDATSVSEERRVDESTAMDDEEYDRAKKERSWRDFGEGGRQRQVWKEYEANKQYRHARDEGRWRERKSAKGDGAGKRIPTVPEEKVPSNHSDEGSVVSGAWTEPPTNAQTYRELAGKRLKKQALGQERLAKHLRAKYGECLSAEMHQKRCAVAEVLKIDLSQTGSTPQDVLGEFRSLLKRTALRINGIYAVDCSVSVGGVVREAVVDGEQGVEVGCNLTISGSQFTTDTTAQGIEAAKRNVAAAVIDELRSFSTSAVKTNAVMNEIHAARLEASSSNQYVEFRRTNESDPKHASAVARALREKAATSGTNVTYADVKRLEQEQDWDDGVWRCVQCMKEIPNESEDYSVCIGVCEATFCTECVAKDRGQLVKAWNDQERWICSRCKSMLSKGTSPVEQAVHHGPEPDPQPWKALQNQLDRENEDRFRTGSWHKQKDRRSGPGRHCSSACLEDRQRKIDSGEKPWGEDVDAGYDDEDRSNFAEDRSLDAESEEDRVNAEKEVDEANARRAAELARAARKREARIQVAVQRPAGSATIGVECFRVTSEEVYKKLREKELVPAALECIDFADTMIRWDCEWGVPPWFNSRLEKIHMVMMSLGDGGRMNARGTYIYDAWMRHVSADQYRKDWMSYVRLSKSSKKLKDTLAVRSALMAPSSPFVTAATARKLTGITREEAMMFGGTVINKFGASIVGSEWEERDPMDVRSYMGYQDHASAAMEFGMNPSPFDLKKALKAFLEGKEVTTFGAAVRRSVEGAMLSDALIKQMLAQYFPRKQFAYYNEAWVTSAQLKNFLGGCEQVAHDSDVARHYVSHCRLEVVVGDTNEGAEGKTAARNRRGVSFIVGCTACGALEEFVYPIENEKRKFVKAYIEESESDRTGARTCREKRKVAVQVPWDKITTEMLWDMDAPQWENASWSWSVRDWFVGHITTNRHRHAAYVTLGHLEAGMGPILGQTGRFNAVLLGPSAPLQVKSPWGSFLVPGGSAQGATMPTREHMIAQIGDVNQVLRMFLQALSDNHVRLCVTAAEMTAQKLRPTGKYEISLQVSDVQKVEGHLVYWNRDNIDEHYDAGENVVMIAVQDLYPTAAEYFEEVLNVVLTPATAKLPAAMYEYLLHEKGMTKDDRTKRIFTPPEGYVPFEKKLAAWRQEKTWVEPRKWKDGMPTPFDLAMLQRYPVSVGARKRPDLENVRGSGWYYVVMITIDEYSQIYTEFRIKQAAACVEQILNAEWNKVDAWTLGIASLVTRDDDVSAALDRHVRRGGVWRLASDIESSVVDLVSELESESGSYMKVDAKPGGSSASSSIWV